MRRDRVGVPVPLHETMERLIKAKEDSWVRVCIVGCGAVGSLFAANLATLDDVEVWAYDLAQAHVDAINRDGLRLTGAGEVLGHPQRDERCLRAAAVRLRHRRHEGDAHRLRDRGDRARVRRRLCRHGAERDRQRRGARPHVERVIRGTTFPAGKITAPGVVQWDVKGDTTFGPFEDKPAPFDEVERLAEACTRAACRPRRSPTRAGPQWRKVIFNAATNPLGALTGLTHGRVCERPDLRRLASRLVDEGKAVASAQGIELDADPEELIDYAARPDVAYDHKASMLQDVEARRQTEVDYLNGGIAGVRAAARRSDTGT